MSEHASASHNHPTAKLFVMVWVGLVALTGIEVLLGYEQLEPKLMLVLLLSLSILKAGMIIGYFMHLRYERPSLALLLIPALCICICLMAIFFPDAARAFHLRV